MRYSENSILSFDFNVLILNRIMKVKNMKNVLYTILFNIMQIDDLK